MTAPAPPRPRRSATGALGTVLQPWLPRVRRTSLDPLHPRRHLVARTAWQALCDAGAAGVLVPVTHGGQGAGLVEAVEVARGLTRLACPAPFLSSAVLATRLAVGAGADALLAELATGDRVAAVAVGGSLSGPPWAPVLSGLLEDVLHGAEADVWLVLAGAPEGDRVLVELPRPPFEVVPTADPTRPVVQARLDAVPVRVHLAVADALLARTSAAAEVVRCAEVLAAAELVLPDDPGSERLLQAARALVDHAAAAADVEGAVDVDLLAQVTAWAERVAARVPVGDPSSPHPWARLRAAQASGWRPGRCSGR